MYSKEKKMAFAKIQDMLDELEWACSQHNENLTIEARAKIEKIIQDEIGLNEKRKITKKDVEFLNDLQNKRNKEKKDNNTPKAKTYVIKYRCDYETTEDNANYIVLYENDKVISIEELYKMLINIQNDKDLNKDYYTDDVILKDVELENDTVKFKYFCDKVYIKIDKNNQNAISMMGICYDELEHFLCEKGYEDIMVIFMATNWENKFCFLTEDEAKDYLRKFSYEYPSDAYVDEMQTYENGELEKLMEIVENVDWKIGL